MHVFRSMLLIHNKKGLFGECNNYKECPKWLWFICLLTVISHWYDRISNGGSIWTPYSVMKILLRPIHSWKEWYGDVYLDSEILPPFLHLTEKMLYLPIPPSHSSHSPHLKKLPIDFQGVEWKKNSSMCMSLLIPSKVMWHHCYCYRNNFHDAIAERFPNPNLIAWNLGCPINTTLFSLFVHHVLQIYKYHFYLMNTFEYTPLIK